MAQIWIGSQAMKAYPNSFRAPRQPIKHNKIGNHGGSPPILGLKRDHPRAWGNKDQPDIHNITTMHKITILNHTIQFITKQLSNPKLITRIHPLNPIEG